MRAGPVLEMSARAYENRSGYGLQRQNFDDAGELDRFLGHAENDAGGFVLRDGNGASLLHFQHAPRTVVSHSGQDYTDNIPAGITSCGAEQNIDRGAMAADQGTLLYFDVVTGPASLQQKMVIARRDQSTSAQNGVIRLGFFHGDVAPAIEPIGKCAGKELRHMLPYDDSRRIGRKRLEQSLQCLGPSGGCADDDHAEFSGSCCLDRFT